MAGQSINLQIAEANECLKQAKQHMCALWWHIYPHPGGSESCPGHGKYCGNCRGANHFSRLCQSKGESNARSDWSPQLGNKKKQGRNRFKSSCDLNQLEHRPEYLSESESDNDDDYVLMVDSSKRAPCSEARIMDVPVKMIMDTGASVNILDSGTYDRIKTAVLPTTTKVYPYGTGKPLLLLGKKTVPVESKTNITIAKLHVAKNGKVPLLSYETAKELGLIQITVTTISAKDDTLTTDQVIKEYPKLFQGLGKLCHCQVKIHINSNITPVVQPHCRFLFHLCKNVAPQLEDLERQGIINKVEGPTPWVSPIVVAPKPHNPDKSCLCADMR